MNPAGPDTIMEAIIPYRGFLESFIALNRIASIVEIDCGDWQHTRFTLPDAVTYLGLDRSAAVVERNNARFASATHRFAVMPADADDIPVAQLLLMKDALQHLGNDSIRALCDTLFPRFAHCLLTDSYRKLDTPQNTDIPDGGFRCLDLSAAPFHLDGAFVLEFPGENWELKRAFLHRPAAAHHAVIEADIVMLQTADPVVYRDMLDLTGAVNIEYCQRNAIAYESVLGVKSGVSPWMSTYNRIFMLFKCGQLLLKFEVNI